MIVIDIKRDTHKENKEKCYRVILATVETEEASYKAEQLVFSETDEQTISEIEDILINELLIFIKKDRIRRINF